MHSADPFAIDVDKGLRHSPKFIPCRYFYDHLGSQIFEKICQLPEYYLTRSETEILKNFSHEIVSWVPEEVQLVELGSGNSLKTHFLIEALLERRNPVTYSPIDISPEILKKSVEALRKKYPELQVSPLAAEYAEGLRQLDLQDGSSRLILWLGSSIGNYDQDEAVSFLRSLGAGLSSNDHFLIGFDLQKNRAVLESAYSDSQGVTARFNLNLLTRINRELGGEFDPGNFAHLALYNTEKNRIEMYLVSTCVQVVYIASLDHRYVFKKDERIHTEYSYKYSFPLIQNIADQVGLTLIQQWFDPLNYFNLTLFRTGI